MTPKRFIEKILNRIDVKICFPLLAKHRRNKLKSTDFTIISNNCWGGKCYEYFDLPKKTPTVGGYFFAEDYIRFCKNLKYYLSKKLEIIPAQSSKYYDELAAKEETDVPVGRLDDVEIIFLHYQDTDELVKKWERRISRINWDRIILKFSYQNKCSDELIKEFLEIKEFPKFCLVGEKVTGHRDEIVFGRHQGKETVDEMENFNWYVNPTTLINDRL